MTFVPCQIIVYYSRYLPATIAAAPMMIGSPTNAALILSYGLKVSYDKGFNSPLSTNRVQRPLSMTPTVLESKDAWI